VETNSAELVRMASNPGRDESELGHLVQDLFRAHFVLLQIPRLCVIMLVMS
jgi:hypothetical protein